MSNKATKYLNYQVSVRTKQT